MAIAEAPLRDLSDPTVVPEPAGGEEDALLDQLLNFEPGGGETPETPDAPAADQEETYVVQEGDTLTKISQDLGIPLEDLARQNNIQDVNVINTGQEIKYKKPGAAPAEEGMQIGGETITMQEGGTTEEGVLGEPPTPAPGDMVTETDTEGGIDFEAEPVAEAKIDAPPAADEEIIEEPGEVPTLVETTEEQAKVVAETVGATLSDESKTVYDDVIKTIDDLKILTPTDVEEYYNKIAENINDRIEDYNINISNIAEEKRKPTFEGWNKFLAVLGAAMGAYGSAMTGTPNYAQKIIDDAIDRDTQAFLNSKEIRTKALSEQRMDMIMRRGELLQLAQNRVNALMQSKTFELAKEEAKANIKAISDGLEQKKQKNMQDYQLVMGGMIKDLIVSEQTLKSTLNKEQSARLVSQISFKDGKGQTFLAPAYVAQTEKEGQEARKKQKVTQNIIEIADELEPLYEDAARFAPGAFSETRIRINALNKKLESVVKIALGMGAHYTPYEVTIVGAQIPSANDWTEMVGTAKKKINALRDSMVIDMKSERQGMLGEITTTSTQSNRKSIESFKGQTGYSG